MVKKSVALKFVLIAFLLVSVCIYFTFKSNVVLTDNVTVSIDRIENGTIQLSITNHSEFPIEYSSSFDLERYGIGGWYRISLLPKGGNLLLYSLSNSETRSITIDYASSYPDLQPGRYRIVKEVCANGCDLFIGSEFLLH